MPQSMHGGRHELGQNFLTHSPSITAIMSRVTSTRGPILELGAGDGALSERLAALGRPLTAIDIDEHRAARLARRLPGARVECADALRFPLRAPTIVGNIPFHLTTPILRRLLASPDWTSAVLVTQWEVARKRAGVGGRTMMAAQHAPWFTFELRGRIPSWGFAPRPSVDGGILEITRRGSPFVPDVERRAYQRFVRSVFSGRGGTIRRIVERAAPADRTHAGRALAGAGIPPAALPRDLTPEQWATLWSAL